LKKSPNGEKIGRFFQICLAFPEHWLVKVGQNQAKFNMIRKSTNFVLFLSQFFAFGLA